MRTLLGWYDGLIDYAERFLQKVEHWKIVAQENSEREKELDHWKGDPEGKNAIEQDLKRQLDEMKADLKPSLDAFSVYKKQAEELAIDKRIGQYKNEHKRFFRLRKKRAINIEDLYYLLSQVKGKDQLNEVLRKKVLKYKSERFNIQGYYERAGLSGIKFEELDTLVPTERHKLESILLEATERLRKGLKGANEMTPEHVVRFVMENKDKLPKDELLKRLSSFVLRVGESSAVIDGYEEGLLHLKGYPEQIWVPLMKNVLHRAVYLLKMLPRLSDDVKKTYLGGLVNVVSGKTPKGEFISDKMLKGLVLPKDEKSLGFGITDKDAENLIYMRNHFNIRRAA